MTMTRRNGYLTHEDDAVSLLPVRHRSLNIKSVYPALLQKPEPTDDDHSPVD